MSLSVSNVVRVSVNLAPTAVPVRSFGILMIAGDSNVISGKERTRTYSSIEGVATDFGTSAPEYLAAALFFGQNPQPATCMVGRWLRVATSGFLECGILTPTQQMISNWTSITTGAFKVAIDGGPLTAVSSCDFSAQSNLNGVASVITTRLAAASLGATCTWDGSSFIITSTSTGTSSAVGFLASPASGADISAQLKGTSGTAIGQTPGYAAEQPVDCVSALANLSTAWYGLMFSASTQPTDDQSIAVSAFVEALDITRLYGVTTIDANTLSSGSTSDLAYRMQQAAYLQSLIQYCSSNTYAVASLFGRGSSVDFTQPDSTITLMFKQEPGVSPEDLTQTQADVLATKRCNVFVEYVNDTAILQYGVVSGSAFIDEIWGLDWLQNALQTAGYNLLYTSPTKIPQTDPGVNQIVNSLDQVLDQAVSNGLVAPGVWTAPLEFGQLKTGQYLKTGYYVYAQPVALQSQSDREARKAPPIQIAIKLAGAIQSMDVVVDVNR